MRIEAEIDLYDDAIQEAVMDCIDWTKLVQEVADHADVQERVSSWAASALTNELDDSDIITSRVDAYLDDIDWSSHVDVAVRDQVDDAFALWAESDGEKVIGDVLDRTIRDAVRERLHGWDRRVEEAEDSLSQLGSEIRGVAVKVDTVDAEVERVEAETQKALEQLSDQLRAEAETLNVAKRRLLSAENRLAWACELAAELDGIRSRGFWGRMCWLLLGR